MALISGIKATQRLAFKDNELVKSVEGVELLTTQLMLETFDTTPQMTVDVESGTRQAGQDDRSSPLVHSGIASWCVATPCRTPAMAPPTPISRWKTGSPVKAGDVVATTQILCKQAGVAQLPEATEAEPVRRLIVERPEDTTTISHLRQHRRRRGSACCRRRFMSWLGQPSDCCGEVEAVDGSSVTLRLGRPTWCRPTPCSTFAMVILSSAATAWLSLVFERQKTGDIVQGLPRIEELLEARRPRESSPFFAGSLEPLKSSKGKTTSSPPSP